MNATTRSPFTPLLLLLLSLPLASQAQFSFVTNNGAITITGYTGPGGTVDIPSEIYGLPVTSIEYAAFEKNANLTIVSIPEGITNIGGNAFASCGQLASVTIPNGVIGMGVSAFGFCPKLTNAVIGSSIGPSAFEYCGNLTTVSLGNSSAAIGKNAFYGSGLTSVTIPDSVVTIGDNAFLGCKFTNVAVPNSVTNLGKWAFYNCPSLITITIGPGVTVIRENTFGYCSSLINVSLPNSVTAIEGWAFQECASLTTITIPASVTVLGSLVFSSCWSLTGVFFQGNAPATGYGTIGGGVTTIYYLPGTTGWGSMFANRPTEFWVLPSPVILGNSSYFGVQTNTFGFLISWATNVPVIVDASTTITSPSWSPVSTNTLVNGTSYFADPNWTNYPARFYRVRSL